MKMKTRTLPVASARKRAHRRASLAMEPLEDRRLLASGPVLSGILSDDGGLLLPGAVKNISPRTLTITFDRGQVIDPRSLGAIQVRASGLDGSFTQGNEVLVTPGYIGIGDNPNQVVVRFASVLADDLYELKIVGSGSTPLRNTRGEAFNNGVDYTQTFELDLGAKVVAIVPQPITRDAGGRLSQARNRIDVYFNNDDLNTTQANNPEFYRLYFTGHINQFDGAFSTVTNTDDGPVILPTSVSYDPALDRAILTFREDLAAFGVGTYRLRIGSDQAIPGPPLRVTLANNVGSSFGTASSVVGTLGTQEQILVSSIDPQPLPIVFPGSNEDPGHRVVSEFFDFHVQRPFDPVDGQKTHDTRDGISTISYNFRTFYGRDGSGNAYRNAITESQKERAREVFELWGAWLGVKFVETPTDGFTIATGDLRVIDPTAFTDPNIVQGAAGLVAGSDPSNIPFGPTAVMNGGQRWNDGFGENWFREAMKQIGHLLGLGAASDLPEGTIMSSNTRLTFGRPAEAVFPGNHDIVHGQYLYRPDSVDIDLYKVVLEQDGQFSAEIMAERLATPSALDSYLRLYRQTGPNAYELVAQNDDYFSQDSLISLRLSAGTYFVGVSSKGNDRYNPVVENSGAGGTTQGAYELRLRHQPTTGSILTDATGVAFDGDGDNVPGGNHNFWFRVQAPGNTFIVDKLASATGNGTLAAPFRTIQQALRVANPGDIVRVLGNNFTDADLKNDVPYQLGFGSFGEGLEDSGAGGLLEIPKGVTLMVDAGAVFKLRGSSIIVGSTSSVQDRSGGALQVLGVPGRPVRFTSVNDETLGVDLTPLPSTPRPGDWGGIIFRDDIDGSLSRFDYEKQGIFLNQITQAEIAYGGGFLTLDAVVGIANPITMIDSRPTITFNQIRNSADAAMSASPDSFEETRFTTPEFQTTPFSPDYHRVGPVIQDNRVTLNTTNGLFVGNRFVTSARGDVQTSSARWTNVDIVHVLSDNLTILGSSGGLIRGTDGQLRARLDARLIVDPGVVVKLEGAHIDVGIGANFIAEGLLGQPIVFTSLQDDRFGAGGTFDTNRDASDQVPNPGDWGGVYMRPSSRGSMDYAVFAYGGGISPIDGSFTAFNVLEAHQTDLRVARSVFEFNASGVGGIADVNRFGRTPNAPGTIYAQGTQAVVLANRFLRNESAVVTIDVNSLSYHSIVDQGRQTGRMDRIPGFKDNQGPLVRENIVGNNGLNGMEVRGGTLTTESVWDDTDIVHIVRDGIFVPNFHTFGGLRLKSSANQSLVIKLSGPTAGFTTTGTAIGIPDHIGGSLQVIGQPGYPVIMTSLFDDTVGAGFDAEGVTQTDTNGGGRPTRSSGERPFKIDIKFGPQISQNAAAVSAIRKAADAWEEELNDPMTVVIDIEIGTFRDELFTGVEFSRNAELMQTTIDQIDIPYGTVRDAMVADRGPHETLLEQLPTRSELRVTLPDPNLGAFGLSPNMRLTRANAKALKLSPGQGTPSQFDPRQIRDGSILVNANFDLFDFDRKDGLLSYREDFQTLMMREIGTILGFRSGVDQVAAALRGFVGDGAIQMYPLDLFRFAPGDGGTDFKNSARLLDPRAFNHVFYAGNTVDFRSLPFEDLAVGDIPLATGFGAERNPQTLELNDNFGAGFWRDDLPIREEKITPFPTIGIMDPRSLLRDNLIYPLDPVRSTAGVLVNITEADRLAFDAIGYDVVGGAPGDWMGIRLEKLTHDGNVAITPERETPESPTTTNATTATAEFLGQLAPDEKSGDETIRLGFQVQGVLSQPSDVDVYAFKARGGTTVYFDIDRTSVGLDTVLELINPDGAVVARSDNSLDESLNPGLLVGIATPLDTRDIYTTNPRDAGMKVVLPGSAALENTYHVRVRSHSPDLNNVTGGLTEGSYQLQIRLQPEDEVPGTSINLAVIRFAESGITVVGPPTRSPLLGEQTEDGTLNDVIKELDVEVVDDTGSPLNPRRLVNHPRLPYSVDAQDLGNVLQTRQGAVSVFGRLNAAEDVDWYRVEFKYADLEPSFATSFFNPDIVGVVFDIDYTDGFGRPDTTLSVFNEVGQLILYSESSNVAADQPRPGLGADLQDLSRGSAGPNDPFIGPVVLAAGRDVRDLGQSVTLFGTGVFYVAVSSVLYAPDPIVNGSATTVPLGNDARERGVIVNGTSEFDSLFSLKTSVPPGAITQGEYSLEIRVVGVPETGFTGENLTLGDKNREREQGSISISGNQIYDSRDWGIRMIDSYRDLPFYGDIATVLEAQDPVLRVSDRNFRRVPHTQFTTGDYIPHAGAPRLLPTVNAERQIPGVSISNNVISNGGEGGLQLQGDPGGIILSIYDFEVYSQDMISQVIAGSEFTLWDHQGRSATFQFEPAAPENIPIRWDLDPLNDTLVFREAFDETTGPPTRADRLAASIEHAIRRSNLDLRVFRGPTLTRGFGSFSLTTLDLKEYATLYVEGAAEIGHPDAFGGRNSVFIQRTPGEDHPYPYLTADFAQQGAVPYVRVVNNTLVGRGGSLFGGTAGAATNPGAADVGILIEDNISPTLLNNIIANFTEGIRADLTSTDQNVDRRTFVGTGYFPQGEIIDGGATGFRVGSISQTFLDNGNIPLPVRLASTGHGLARGRPIDELLLLDRNLRNVNTSFTPYVGARPTVIGGSVYQGNLTDTIRVGRGDFSIRLNNTDPLFVDPVNSNFYLKERSRAIDSAIDRLAERTSLTDVTRAVGIDSAGILAPSTDALGAQRVDDPSVEPPAGFGRNAFKDRGAIERADFVGPLAQLERPADNDSAGLDRNPNRNDVALFGIRQDAFDIRLTDGATLANPTFGSGPDDSTITSAAVRVFRDDVLLTAGVEYVFTYDATGNRIRLSAITGVFQDGLYRIELDNTVILDRAGNRLQPNRADGKTSFSILLGTGFDFGDAPASYKTLLVDDGPRHRANGTLYLGGPPTLEADGRPSPEADADEGDDGVALAGVRFQPNTTVTIQVTASQVGGFLNAWIDLNANGTFEVSDKVVTAVPLVAGVNNVSMFIPSSAVGGSSFARFRFSSVPNLLPTGLAPDGEVEDYLVQIGASSWQNPNNRTDVNNDALVTPLDALLVINELNNSQFSNPTNGSLPDERPSSAPFLDVNGDAFVSPIDALLVINRLSSTSASGLVVYAEDEPAPRDQGANESVWAENWDQEFAAVDAIFAAVGLQP